MNDVPETICGVCGLRPGQNQIYFFRALAESEQEQYGAAAAELDMLLCEACGERAFKHLKRMFRLRDLGLSRRERSRVKPLQHAHRVLYEAQGCKDRS